MSLALRQPHELNGAADRPNDDASDRVLAKFDGMMKIAEVLFKGGMAKGAKNPEAVFSLMLLCESQGLPFGDAMLRYNVIEGRPTMTAQAMLAEFMARGGRVRWGRHDDQYVEGWFSHVDNHPEEFHVAFDLQTLVEKGVATRWSEQHNKYVLKDNYAKWSEDMLRARVASRGIRAVYPGLAIGIYTPEEVSDFDEAQSSGRVIDQSPREPLPPIPPRPAPPKPPEPDEIRLPGQTVDGYDRRPYSRVVAFATEAVNAEGKDIGIVVDIKAVHRHMVDWAVGRGFGSPVADADGTVGSKAAFDCLNKVYAEYRAETRAELASYLASALEIPEDVAEPGSEG